MCVENTRIVNFRAYPPVATPGETIRFSGRVESHPPHRFCAWSPLPSAVVEIYVNDVKRVSMRAGGEGEFTWSTSFYEYGEYRVKAKTPGDWWFCPSESEEIVVRVVSQEEKNRWAQEELLKTLAPWLVAGGVVAVAGVVAYAVYSEERRRELMRILLMRG
jgi:hypothetical protein